MSLRPFSTNDRNDLETPVAAATSMRDSPRFRRSSRSAGPSSEGLATRPFLPRGGRPVSEGVLQERWIKVAATCEDRDSPIPNLRVSQDSSQRPRVEQIVLEDGRPSCDPVQPDRVVL